MDSPYTQDELEKAIVETVQANGFKACYIRPLMYRGYNALGVNPRPCPVDVAIMVWEWGTYLGPEALENGVDVCVSSWNRMAPNTFPSLSKTCGNYANAALIRMEAEANGYSEGIALDTFGYVSEGSGENIFVVRNGAILTPPLSASILPGITRDMVMQVAADLGYRVTQENIPREMLYIADEVFFVGTAVEITPVRSVDKIQVGAGRRGPVTEAIQRRFLDVIAGQSPDTHGWLTYVPQMVAAGQKTR
jgi:branched-chain amino acid aminotransferase